MLTQVHEAVVEGTQPTHTRFTTLIPESMHTSQHPSAELSRGDALEESRRSYPIATSSRPSSSFAKSEPLPDYFVGIAAASQDGSDVSTISPVNTSGSRTASQIQAENIRTSLISGTLSSPIPAPALSGNTIPAELPSSTGSAVRLSDYIPHPITSPTSSPTTARRHISFQAPSVSDALVTARMEIVDGHRLLLMSLGSWSVLWVSLKFLKKYCMVRAKRSRCEIRLDSYWVSTRTGSNLPQD